MTSHTSSLSDNFTFSAPTGDYPVKVNIANPTNDTDLKRIYNKKASMTTLVFLNALGVSLRKYDTVIQELTKRGFTVISADYPCSGENAPPEITRDVDYGYNDLIEGFIPNLIAMAKAHTPDNDVVLMGHSLGGHLGTIYSTIQNVPCIGVACGSIHYKTWSGMGRAKIFQAVAAFKALIAIYGYLPGHLVGFGQREPKTQMHNWCHIALTGKFDFINKTMDSNKGRGLYINIYGDDFSPVQSTAALASLCHTNNIVRVKLDRHLKGNPHGAWIKEPSGVISAIMNHINCIG